MIKMEPVIAFTICSLLIGTGFNTAPWLNYIERDPTGMSAYYHQYQQKENVPNGKKIQPADPTPREGHD